MERSPINKTHLLKSFHEVPIVTIQTDIFITVSGVAYKEIDIEGIPLDDCHKVVWINTILIPLICS